jgi:hypothetical protein
VTEPAAVPTDPPWVAFVEGRWEESLELIEAAPPAFRKFIREASDHAVTLHRVRIVKIPILPYLHWELHYLLLAVDEGEKIRVVEADRISEFESNGPLPELPTAGRDTVYRILYTDEGVPAEARRVIDSARACRYRIHSGTVRRG